MCLYLIMLNAVLACSYNSTDEIGWLHTSQPHTIF